MKTYNKAKHFSFEGEKVFIGIDMHKTNWIVSILGEHVAHKTFSQDPNADALSAYLNKHFPEATYYSAYEAGFSGFWAHDQLTSLGIKSIVVNPSDIPTTDKEKRQKEDKRDSRKIARGLRAGTLTAIRVPCEKNRYDRALLRVRRSLLKDLQRNKNRIKGFLYFHGITYPPRFARCGTHWSNVFMHWLESLQLAQSSGQDALLALIGHARYLREELLLISRKIKALSQTAYYADNVRWLCSIPGIATLTAMTLLTELEHITHYKNVYQLCSYIGVVPSTNSSSDKERVGGITPRGKKHLRRMLVESAWIAVRCDPGLMKKYNQLRARMKPNKAIIRITKKLAARIRYVLIHQKEYQILTHGS